MAHLIEVREVREDESSRPLLVNADQIESVIFYPASGPEPAYTLIVMASGAEHEVMETPDVIQHRALRS